MTMLSPFGATAPNLRSTVPVAVYGNRWCGLTQMIRRALRRDGVDHEFVDLDLYPDAERKLQRLAGGRLRTPVVYVGGEWLMEPSLRDVQNALARHGAGW